MPIRAVENRRLYRQIADQLSMLIASHEFPEGARLPSERDLAMQLGVSRPSVREALIALEIEGKVEVRVGSGIYVVPQRLMQVADPTSEGQGPFELLRARWLIEGEVAAEAARKAEPKDLNVVVLPSRTCRGASDSRSTSTPQIAIFTWALPELRAIRRSLTWSGIFGTRVVARSGNGWRTISRRLSSEPRRFATTEPF